MVEIIKLFQTIHPYPKKICTVYNAWNLRLTVQGSCKIKNLGPALK